MTCVGGDACGAFRPTVMQCRNVGSDGFDSQWKCETDLPTDYRLGQTPVSCEGYDHPGTSACSVCDGASSIIIDQFPSNAALDQHRRPLHPGWQLRRRVRTVVHRRWAACQAERWWPSWWQRIQQLQQLQQLRQLRQLRLHQVQQLLLWLHLDTGMGRQFGRGSLVP